MPGATGIHLVTELRKTVAGVRVIARSQEGSRGCFLTRQSKMQTRYTSAMSAFR